jgi:hypothetical protein
MNKEIISNRRESGLELAHFVERHGQDFRFLLLDRKEL